MRPIPRPLPLVLAALTLLATVAPAVAASRAGRTDLKRRAPYYTGKAPGNATVAHLPVRPGPAFAETGRDAGMSAAVEAVLPEVQRFLDGLDASRRLDPGASFDPQDAPRVYVGRHDGFYAPEDGVMPLEAEAIGRTTVILHVSDPPSRAGRALGARAAEAGADHVLHVMLDLSDYPIAQKNWKGSKAVELGTGHLHAVPWLTSLDQPAEVIHFTGALYRADGKFVRAGAEAFHANRTRFRESVAGLQRTHTPGDLEAAFQAVRDDLPGEPLAWQVALRHLVANLTGPRGAGTPGPN